eukprot:COSAG05_NODE_111_length_18575_cov_3.808292_14_plen_262_part_00
MSLSLLVGLIFGFYVMERAIGLDQVLQLFYQLDSLWIVLGGTFAAVTATYPLKNMIQVPVLLLKAFSLQKNDAKRDILFLVSLAKKAKEKGRRALVEDIKGVKNLFLKVSLQLMIDNASEEGLEKLMVQNIAYIQKKDMVAIRIFSTFGKYAPAFGLLGTVIGLVKLLSQLNDPSAVGPGMSLALITTFYGIVLSNLVFLPLAGRLELYSDEQALHSEMLMVGVLAIVRQENSYMVKEKMELFYNQKIKDKQKKKLKGKAA